MKKILSLVLALALLCSMLPVSALAAYDATKPACQVPGHEKFDGTDHNRPQSCWTKGHFGCDGMDHSRAACGVEAACCHCPYALPSSRSNAF